MSRPADLTMSPRPADLTMSLVVTLILFASYAAKYFAMNPLIALRPTMRSDLEITVEQWDDSLASAYIAIVLVKMAVGPWQ